MCIHAVRQALLLDRDQFSVAMIDWDAIQDGGVVVGDAADVLAASRTADGGDPRPRCVCCVLLRVLSLCIRSSTSMPINEVATVR